MLIGPRWRVLTGVMWAAVGCGGPAGDPVPVLSDLTCEVTRDESSSSASFLVHYVDGDADLSPDGVIQWWVEDIQQTDLPLNQGELGTTGTLVLNVSPLQNYEEYAVRLLVLDGAGNSSNTLSALINTDTNTCGPTD